MDETHRSNSSWWRVLAVPLLVLLAVPLTMLLALAFYVRAVVFAIVQMLGWRGQEADLQPIQGPHLFQRARHESIARDGATD